jgi:NAD(P)-dependent dehydrogenase (short-subunit alcohol dehydrogenase family)
MSPMNPSGETAFWQGRRVLVTGCTGLVGAWTTRLLVSRGAHVVGLVRDRIPGSDLARSGLLRRIDRVHGSLEDLPLLERAVNEYEVQTIIHLAAQTIVGTANRSPMATFEANIRGTYHLLEAARRSGLNPDVVLASSDKAYGDQRGGAYNEQTPLRPEHPYDVSKACADMIGRAYAVTYGLPVCVTRCGNFFGGGDLNWNRIVPGTIKALLEDRPPVLRSTGAPVRDYTPRTAPRPTCSWPGAWRKTAPSMARRSTSRPTSASAPSTWSSGFRGWPADGTRPACSPTPPTRFRTRKWTVPRRARCSGGSPATASTRRFWKPWPGTGPTSPARRPTPPTPTPLSSAPPEARHHRPAGNPTP